MSVRTVHAGTWVRGDGDSIVARVEIDLDKLGKHATKAARSSSRKTSLGSGAFTVLVDVGAQAPRCVLDCGRAAAFRVNGAWTCETCMAEALALHLVTAPGRRLQARGLESEAREILSDDDRSIDPNDDEAPDLADRCEAGVELARSVLQVLGVKP